tara:strand:+ start:393 stop:1265 length:873 start_codon:yes stop_codon:yes gene_type:complete
MNLSPAIIKELREKSGAGMMDCKKALDESGGNVEKAIEWLRKKGINTAQKKSSRSASDGLITVKIEDNRGVIMEVNAETDFVARNENFQKFCDELALTALKNEAENVENLLNCKFLDSNQKVKENLTNLISKLGENIVIRKLKYMNDKLGSFEKYLHNSINLNSGKIGVLLSFKSNQKTEKVKDFSKNLCMHIAATDPKSFDIESLDKKLVDKERSIYTEQLKSSNKPDDIIEKIVDGKIKKFYQEVCLLEQMFVMDNKIKIYDCIAEFNKENNENFEITNFVIFKLGQE